MAALSSSKSPNPPNKRTRKGVRGGQKEGQGEGAVKLPPVRSQRQRQMARARRPKALLLGPMALRSPRKRGIWLVFFSCFFTSDPSVYHSFFAAEEDQEGRQGRRWGRSCADYGCYACERRICEKENPSSAPQAHPSSSWRATCGRTIPDSSLRRKSRLHH